MKNLIKAGHLGRYITEINHGVELGQATDKATAGAAASSESRLTINYILGISSDDQYQSKRQ